MCGGRWRGGPPSGWSRAAAAGQIDDAVGDQRGDGVRPVAAGVHAHAPPRPCPARPPPTRGRSARRPPSVGPGWAAPAPRRPALGGVDLQESKPGPSVTTNPGNPASATSRLEPLPTTSTGTSSPARDRATSTRAASSTGSVPRAARAPDPVGGAAAQWRVRRGRGPSRRARVSRSASQSEVAAGPGHRTAGDAAEPSGGAAREVGHELVGQRG